jgi:hypothetical protein
MILTRRGRRLASKKAQTVTQKKKNVSRKVKGQGRASRKTRRIEKKEKTTKRGRRGRVSRKKEK